MLLGAVGGPKWDGGEVRPEQGLLGLRKGSACTRTCGPVRPIEALYDASPLRREIIERTDLLVVRELTGGIYFGDKGRERTAVPTTCACTRWRRSNGSRSSASRPPAAACRSVDKANVLETSRLWRETVTRVHAERYPNIELQHVLVDNAAMQLVASPRHFDVILTENMFGDILSDEAAMLTGSIGMLPSASLGEPDTPGVFEPVHGSAPGHHGPGHRQPAGDDPLRGDDAPARTRP